jgi:hypothetical protein
MADTRKGFLTPEQEVILDSIIVFKNKLAEKADGPAIRLIDNQGLERTKKIILEKFPDALPYIYDVVDTLMEFVAENLTPKEEV